MERVAIVTGSSSGIGEAIVKTLLSMDYEVYGIGRDFSASDVLDEKYHRVVCDLLDEKQTKSLYEQIPFHEVTVLVNNAGCAYYGMHEELKEKAIAEMVRVNLEVPMLLTNHYLRALRENRGYVINIESVTALHASPHGAAYGATKAGLLAFTNSIWEENRKYGVKVCSILPDMTDTQLYRNANFGCSEEFGCALDSLDVAHAVENILKQPEHMCMNMVVLRPQYHRIAKKKNASK